MLMIGKIVSVLNEGILIFGANLKILESPVAVPYAYVWKVM